MCKLSLTNVSVYVSHVPCRRFMACILNDEWTLSCSDMTLVVGDSAH